MKSITITLPIPPKCLHPNAGVPITRGGIIGRKKAIKAYRAAAAAVAEAKWVGNNAPRWERATVAAVFYFALDRRRDRDNLNAWLKSALDGLQDAEVIVNDNGLIPLPPTTAKAKDRFSERVEITITQEA